MNEEDEDIETLFGGFETKKKVPQHQRFTDSDAEENEKKEVKNGEGGSDNGANAIATVPEETHETQPQSTCPQANSESNIVQEELEELLLVVHPDTTSPLKDRLRSLVAEFHRIQAENLELKRSMEAQVSEGRNKSGKKRKAKKSRPNTGGADLFFLDSGPVEEGINDDTPVPSSTTTNQRYDVLSVCGLLGSEKREENTDNKRAGGRSCFNCEQVGHGIDSCPEPKNLARIRRNKSLQQSFRKPQNVDTSRYHAPDSKFVTFKAGSVSEDLREALGISERDLPPWIYNMRALGYPPGYLKAAVEKQCGLDFFDGEDSIDDSEESGPKLTVEDIQKYPGFNIDLDCSVRDEGGRRHGLLPMQPQQSTEDLLKEMNKELRKEHRQKLSALKRRRNNSTLASLSQLDTTDVVDMDVTDDSVGDTSFLPLPPPPPFMNSGKNSSITELMRQKEKLRNELANLANGEEEGEIDANPASPDPDGEPLIGNRPMSIQLECDDPSDDRSTTPLHVGAGAGHSVAVTHGTPTLGGSLSGSAAKPSLNAFAQGIEEFKPLEDNQDNPTTSRGTFRSMLKVLKSKGKK